MLNTFLDEDTKLAKASLPALTAALRAGIANRDVHRMGESDRRSNESKGQRKDDYSLIKPFTLFHAVAIVGVSGRPENSRLPLKALERRSL